MESDLQPKTHSFNCTWIVTETAYVYIAETKELCRIFDQIYFNKGITQWQKSI